MNHLTTQQSYILIRSDFEIVVDQARAERLCAALKSQNPPRMLEIDGQFVNTFEIIGIFTAAAMEDRRRRKNGQWQCQKRKWHERNQDCHCPAATETVTRTIRDTGVVTYQREKRGD